MVEEPQVDTEEAENGDIAPTTRWYYAQPDVASCCWCFNRSFLS